MESMKGRICILMSKGFEAKRLILLCIRYCISNMHIAYPICILHIQYAYCISNIIISLFFYGSHARNQSVLTIFLFIVVFYSSFSDAALPSPTEELNDPCLAEFPTAPLLLRSKGRTLSQSHSLSFVFFYNLLGYLTMWISPLNQR